MAYGNGYFDTAYGNWLPDDPKYYCDHCGEQVDSEDDLHEVWLDKYVCDDCYNDYIKCEHCGNEVHVDDSQNVDKKDYCEDCYSEYVKVCAICNQEYFNEDEDVKICSKCESELVK